MTENEFNNLVAENLVKQRKQHSLTQGELANKINYSDKSISKWERGEGMPSVYVLMLLSDIYGVSVSELIGQTKSDNNLFGAEKPKKIKEKSKIKAFDRVEKSLKKHLKRQP